MTDEYMERYKGTAPVAVNELKVLSEQVIRELEAHRQLYLTDPDKGPAGHTDAVAGRGRAHGASSKARNGDSRRAAPPVAAVAARRTTARYERGVH